MARFYIQIFVIVGRVCISIITVNIGGLILMTLDLLGMTAVPKGMTCAQVRARSVLKEEGTGGVSLLAQLR